MKRHILTTIVLTACLSSIALQASDPNNPAEGTQPEKIIGVQDNNSGECNVPSSNTGFKAVVAGDVHSLAIKRDGSISAWGNNNSGERDVPLPNTGFIAVAAGKGHSLGLKSDGSIVAWGRNSSGECSVPLPNTDFVAVVSGYLHSLGLKRDGSIVAWGNNDYGECNVPSPNTGFKAVAAGYIHSLGLKEDGSIVAWGNNEYNQCNVPLPNTGFVAIAASGGHGLGLKTDGSVAAWGNNDYGQCNVPSPNTGFAAVAAGKGHSLAVKQDGSIVAWGNNDYGECNVPLPNTDFVAVAAGKGHSLGLKADGSIVAWGWNAFGQCTVPSSSRRGDTLEQRIRRLESQRIEPNLPEDENKDALRVERMSKKIQEMEDAIELDETHINVLPSICCPLTKNCPPPGLRRDEELQKALEIATKKWQFLADQERNYMKMIQYAEKYTDLGIDVMDMKKNLIECQGRKKIVELVKECLREKIEQSKHRPARQRPKSVPVQPR